MTAALLAGLTFILGIGTNWWTTRRALAMQYDADLRRDRLTAYAKLWSHLAGLNKYGSRTPGLSRYEVGKLADALTHWYFNVGGLYLSVPARNDYFGLQDALQHVLERDPGEEMNLATREFVRLQGSRLRTSLSRDVGTRKPLHLRGDPNPRPGRSLLGTFTSGDGREIRLSRRRFGGIRIRQEPPGVWDSVRWDNDAWAVRVQRGEERRQLMLDSRGLVEGAVGWEPEEPQRPPAVWRRS
jgi:hypothetical protein